MKPKPRSLSYHTTRPEWIAPSATPSLAADAVVFSGAVGSECLLSVTSTFLVAACGTAVVSLAAAEFDTDCWLVAAVVAPPEFPEELEEVLKEKEH